MTNNYSMQENIRQLLRRMRRNLKRFLLLWPLVALAACQNNPTPTTGTDVSCQAFCLVSYSASGDTEATKDQVKAHNRVLRSICETPLKCT